MENSLQHHGVKGMKWGVRKERDYAVRTSIMKSKHSEDRYTAEAERHKAELEQMKSLGWEKWARENDLYITDEDKEWAKNEYKLYQQELNNRIKSAEHFAKNSPSLMKRIDSIDTSSVSYKEAVRLLKQHQNDWLNEVIETDPTIVRD